MELFNQQTSEFIKRIEEQHATAELMKNQISFLENQFGLPKDQWYEDLLKKEQQELDLWFSERLAITAQKVLNIIGK